jgi:hypothetical protein
VSFIGRAAVWAPVGIMDADIDGETIDIDQSRREAGPAFTGTRLTPLNMMTGSRIAASGGVVRWVGGASWGDPLHSGSPARSEPPRRPYRQFLARFARQRSGPPEIHVCPRCGQAPHIGWGHEYERLVCQEITAA